MSASAGRVLILLKGEYNSATSYQMLDAVRYNGSLYIAKKATLGNVPQDGEYWMLCASGATWGDIGGIITNQTDLMNILNGKQNTLTFDTVPTASSTNPVTSAGIKTAVDAKITNPTGGSVGDVLRKTATGEAWVPETGSAWGSITGNIDSQTDLKTKLDASASNIATIESTAFASKAYAEGEFLTYNGQLYEVIAAIALGEALVIGTNIEAKSVSDKFVSINSEIETLNNGLTRGYSAYMDWPTITINNGSWQNNTGGSGTGVKPDRSSASGYNLALNVPGRYLIFCIARFIDGANTSGIRGIRLIVNENPVQEDFIAVPANDTTIQTMGMVNNTSGSDRVRMGFFQNSGGALQVQGIHLYAIYMGNW